MRRITRQIDNERNKQPENRNHNYPLNFFWHVHKYKWFSLLIMGCRQHLYVSKDNIISILILLQSSVQPHDIAFLQISLIKNRLDYMSFYFCLL